MRYQKILFCLLFFALSFDSLATHIRAGEVIARRLSALTYEFTFFGYRDEDGVLFGQGRFNFGDGEIWGDDPTDSDALRSHVYQLRKAIDKPFDTAIIKTIHSVGLALDIA